MLSGIASYLFGGSEETEDQQQKPLEPRLQTRYAENCDWIIVDQSSRGRSEERVEASPMENLLIEHPSMSVYGPRGRNSSTGVESDLSESSNDSETAAGPSRPAQTRAVHRCPPRQPKAVAQRAGLIARVQSVRAAQKAVQHKEKRQLAPNQLNRSNRVHEYKSHNKHQRRRDFMRRPSGRSNDRRC